MKKMFSLFVFLIFVGMQIVNAQSKQITGLVTNADDGLGMPGVSIVIKGTTIGTSTDIDGKFTFEAKPSDVLMFSFVGMVTQEIKVGDQTIINVVLKSQTIGVDEVVVTALGIKREAKSLGYAVQQVGGDEVATAKDASFISSLSGKVSGVNIKKPGQIGGSTNIIIRGSNSFTGNNQALFVVDGIPISNATNNTRAAQIGDEGYDYGNAASDIDPESIESISVLKGATASALYGSDAANGVVLITTKKGKKNQGIGVTINQSFSWTKYEKETFPEYQDEYGAGYGPYYGDTGYFFDKDFDGDGTIDFIVPVGEDASYGARYDPNLMVFQWDALYPQLDTYKQKSPWVAAENGADSFFQTGFNSNTTIAIDGGNETSTFRMSYTNNDTKGIIENSKIKKDIVDFAASHEFTDKLKVDGKITFTRVSGKGRYGTGYDSKNTVQGFRQWFQTNVDIKQQRNAYFATRDNITWNPISESDLTPHYFNNPYWNAYENYQTDIRNRFFGKFQMNYRFNDHFDLLARVGIDSYNEIREERSAIGSLDIAEYVKFENTFEEYNHDLILNFNHDFSEAINLHGLVGMSIKNKKEKSTRASTNGGLINPRIYALSNSRNLLEPPEETDIHKLKYGYYTQVSLGLWNKWYIEGSLRVDQSSTLPSDNDTYAYPSISSSFVFDELLDIPWLSFGKLRVGYAEVANDAPSYSIKDTYYADSPFNSTPMYYIYDYSNNKDLKAETTKEFEIGLEMNILQNRAGFNLSYYNKKTIDQIMPVEVSNASGINFRYVNAGEMQNKGVELSLFGSPIKTKDFQWNVNVNWAKNKNEVVELFEGGQNLLIYSAWNTAINARKGEAYGTITGYDFKYDNNGNKVIGPDGKYMLSDSSTEILGNIQPDWTGGISNSFRYKNLSFSFLIDIQKGGDVVSYDMAYGLATGLYKETAGLNELGNPVRDPVSQGGGVLLKGVDMNGNPNTVRADASTYENAFGYYGGTAETGGYNPEALFVYDASFVKLREVTLNYSFPKHLCKKIHLVDLSLGVYGRNLWIIDKNLPYSDPEYATSAGNYQGIQNGAMPSTKQYGVNLKIKF